MKQSLNEFILWITGQDYVRADAWLNKQYAIDLDVGRPDYPLVEFYGKYFQIVRTIFLEKMGEDISQYRSFNEMLEAIQNHEDHEELGFFISWLRMYSNRYIVSPFGFDNESLQAEELLDFFEYYMINMTMAYDSRQSDYETFLKQMLNISVKLSNKVEELQQFVFTVTTGILVFEDVDIDVIRETPIEKQEVSLYV